MTDHVEEGGAGELVLEYQRAEKRHKRASAGLLVLAGALMALVFLAGFPVVLDAMAMRSRGGGGDMIMGMFLVPLVWSATYLTMAILFRMRMRWAGWVAFGMTGAKLAVWGYVFLWMWMNYFDGNGPGQMGVMVVLLLAVGSGLGAVMVEVWMAQRVGKVWGVKR